MGNVLVRNGYDILTAQNGKAGLEVAEQHVPGLVLLDIGMPIMDGRGFMTAYPRHDVPVVVLTGRQDDGEWPHAESILGQLSKPFDVDELLDIVERALASPTTDSAVQPEDESAALLGSIAADREPLKPCSTIYELHQAACYGLCVRVLSDHSLAEDALQEAFFTVAALKSGIRRS